MALHKDITGANNHEPKGVENASSGQVYIANGSGSGSWQDLAIPDGTFLVQHSLFTTSGTWTKPSDLMFIRVIIQGGGQGGHYWNTDNLVWYPGSNGLTSSFGSHVSATGGGAALGSTGDINVSGTYMLPPSLPYVTHNGGYCSLTSSGTSLIVYAVPRERHFGLPGNAALKVIQAASLASTVTVTIGTGGSKSAVGGASADGTAGLCVVESYIQV